MLAVGGARVAAGSMEISSLIAFLLYLFFLVTPIGQFMQSFTQMQNGLAAVARIEEIAQLPSEPGPAQLSQGYAIKTDRYINVCPIWDVMDGSKGSRNQALPVGRFTDCGIGNSGLRNLSFATTGSRIGSRAERACGRVR